MKSVFKILFLILCISVHAQKNIFVLVDHQTGKEYIRKDSAEAAHFLDSLATHNYYFTKLIRAENREGTTRIVFDKGKNFNEAYVRYGDSIQAVSSQKDEFLTHNLDSLRSAIHQKYIDLGYTFSRVKTKYLGLKNGIPQVELSMNLNRRRTIDGFVIKGYEKVPKQFVRNLEKQFRGKVYDPKNLEAISESLQNHTFVKLEKDPQTLFTKDSTQVFLFLQKKKSNTFDGIVGFGNSDSEKFTFNGTLNIAFRNMFNGFEAASLYWQRNPDKGQTFDLNVNIPYLFRSNIGLEMKMNIYRQDSTYANVKILPGLFYNLSSRQRMGVRGNFEMSSVIDSTYTLARDFSRSGLGVWYEFQQAADIELFLYNAKIRAEADFLTTTYDDDGSKASMVQYYLLAEKNFRLGGRHYLNIKAESAMLNSDQELSVNELFRTGGWNSFRGFSESSLLSDFYAYGGAEYRYLVSRQAFFDVFAQYGQLTNKTMQSHPKLYSFGLGFSFFLPLGLMTFQLSNGSQVGEPFSFRETKIHWGIVSRF